ncbi:MAG: hypothetical protein WC595_00260 [Candidatus Nanoarchaeia archaeon]
MDEVNTNSVVNAIPSVPPVNPTPINPPEQVPQNPTLQPVQPSAPINQESNPVNPPSVVSSPQGKKEGKIVVIIGALAFIFSCVSLAFWTNWLVIGVLIGLIGSVLGVITLKKDKENRIALIGLVINVISLLILSLGYLRSIV